MGRADALGCFSGESGRVRRSFVAAPLAFPLMAAVEAIDALGGLSPGWWREASLQAIGFAIAWCAVALATREATRLMACGQYWGRYVVAWNWTNLVQYGLLLLGCVPTLVGAPAPVQQAVTLVVLGWALWIEWFATRLTLQLDGLRAAALVALDVAISLGVGTLAALLAGS